MSPARWIAAVAAGLVAGAGCGIFCADCKCPPGVTEIVGDVTEADRAELIGGTVTVSFGMVTVDYTGDEGATWRATYTVNNP